MALIAWLSASQLTRRDTDRVSYHDDPIGYEARLTAKLAPARIRSTLAFAGLYQITNEMIRHAVTVKVREFFQTGFADGEWLYDETAYASDVLARAKGRFHASLLWLMDSGAISAEQADRLDAIYKHRNELAHELMTYIVDADREPDIELFIDAVTILKAIMRFWTSIEADYGTFEEFPDIDLDEVVPLSMAVLQQCFDAYAEDLEAVKDGDADGAAG
jgi:hypothetical protein